MPYTTVFFDLDHTLWDFETNSREVLTELSVQYQFLERGVPSFDIFMQDYFLINERLWDAYGKGTINKESLRFDRFYETFKKYGITDRSLTDAISNDYVSLSPLKKNLFPHAITVLNYLREKYALHIITNGFEEVQYLKLKSSGIDHYFSNVITSESSGYQKPDKRMFDYALQQTQSNAANSCMIGDSLQADVLGARDAGMQSIYFNPKEIIHSENTVVEIKSLNELITLL
jgi:putative hydrolase of the HAD superfamily